MISILIMSFFYIGERIYIFDFCPWTFVCVALCTTTRSGTDILVEQMQAMNLSFY